MDHAQHNQIVNFIWGIADDILRDVYVRGKYRDVILPMTVIRRLDALLEPTKEAVLEMKAALDRAGVSNQAAALQKEAGQAFYNTSPFTLRSLLSSPKQLRPNFTAYLDGYSENVREILEKFEFRNQLQRLEQSDTLFPLIERFLDPRINLSPNPVLDTHGQVKLPGLDNHAMGTIFEELIRRFNEENNEEAGEHFTPRDVVALMTNLIFRPITDQIVDGTYLVYDGACGTGGMLTVAEETLQQLADEHGKSVSIHLYGQEVNGETYAISKADLLLKGEGQNADNIAYGSTLAADGFPSIDFDFMLSNPPYGKSWKNDLDRLGGAGKKGDVKDPRFVVSHDGDPEFNLITRTSDGQLMFLVNMLSKMNHSTPLGSRIAEVHNGSALFTGDAGQGESNIRRWIIENDWLEAIVALPEKIFYNTGIATYVWILTNRKPAHRTGKVQLIDATGWHQPLRRNLGQRNREMTPAHIAQVVEAFERFEETEQSKIFPNEAFGYWKVTVERPLRLRIDFDPETRSRFRETCRARNDEPLADLIDDVASQNDPELLLDWKQFLDRLDDAASERRTKLSAARKKLVQSELTVRDEQAQSVLKSSKRISGPDDGDRLHGQIPTEIGGHWFINEYEPDPDLRDTEQIPLLEPGGIAGFIEREVWPHVPDAWVDEAKTQIGYEISFTRYFYKPVPLRTLEEIEADIRALEAETEGLLEEILVGVDR
jgi:type I restriction enzyme M protein